MKKGDQNHYTGIYESVKVSLKISKVPVHWFFQPRSKAWIISIELYLITRYLPYIILVS